MEDLMYYVWQQRLFNQIETIDGKPIEVIHPGLRNHEAGPDFFNAKVRYDGITWAGNVEMHVRASDWYKHKHQDNRIYDSVILHIVLQADTQICHPDGTEIKTMVMHIPDDVMNRYHSLCGRLDKMPEKMSLLPGQTPSYSTISCQPRLAEIPSIIRHDWINALAIQRTMSKMKRVSDLTNQDLKTWEEGFYIMLMRSLGTGTYADAMERVARSLPYSHLLHHRDNLPQLQAMLLGQGSLLDPNTDSYPELKREYDFLRNKFDLVPIPATVWKMGRLRPKAAPQNRLMAMALLINRHQSLLSDVLDARTTEQMEKLFLVEGIGKDTIRIIIINAVIPTLLSYYNWQGKDEECDYYLSILEQLPAERNRYITQWANAGINIKSALESQALLQLTRNYCEPHKCLHCRFGCWLIKHPVIP